MTIFLLSDTHFGHYNIITYSQRVSPKQGVLWHSAEEMDEELVERWNDAVRPQDHVYHLGDVTMKAPGLGIVKRLNGHLRLVRGNHDIFKTQMYFKAGFKEIHGVRVIDNLLMTHIPVHPGSLGRFKGNIHGHTHESHVMDGLIRDKRYLNVCVENINYRPITLEEAKARLIAQEGI
jgi:calcineurin-like phosphoesterase family protein